MKKKAVCGINFAVILKEILLMCLLFICGCGLATSESSPVFVTENISKIVFGFGPAEKREVTDEDMEKIMEWLETFRVGDRVKRRDEQPAGTNSVYVRIEYLDGTIVENGLSTIKLAKKEYCLIYADAPEAYLRLSDSIGK